MEKPIEQLEVVSRSKIKEIGDKVRAKYMTFFNEETNEIHHAWVGYIEVDGKMMGIAGEGTFSGYVESPNRYQALKNARKVRDDGKQRLGQSNQT